MLFANPFKLKKLGILGMNKRNIHYIGAQNNRKYYPLVDNKLKTKVIAENAGIAVPKLLSTIERHSQLRNLKDILVGLDKFVVKPAQGSGGKGILVIVQREGDTFIKPSGQRLDLKDVHRDISNILSGLYSLGGKPDVAMIEQLVEFDPIFDRYSYEGVPDIRVIIYKGYPALAMLRCSTKESDGKANLHQGAVGVGINMASGKALFAVQHGDPVTKHPDTGYDFSELEIPHWEKILTLAASCYEVTHLGYLGVDIVLDKNLGPLILELNARPGLAIQIANRTGAVKRYDVIDKQQVNLDVTERVKFSINHFGMK
ncbi:alpha-L-glutamate ligase-like protein [Sulfurovum sp.]|uniref:alpha-L-glutamate ligase-like protein n=1 Tax=Sulfurovum sp. TaxID=1969726 RepID=UPI0028683872|nr:alpha-L-glutamate ligase-like protein [Sulfurovum sp.]